MNTAYNQLIKTIKTIIKLISKDIWAWLIKLKA